MTFTTKDGKKWKREEHGIFPLFSYEEANDFEKRIYFCECSGAKYAWSSYCKGCFARKEND